MKLLAATALSLSLLASAFAQDSQAIKINAEGLADLAAGAGRELHRLRAR